MTLSPIDDPALRRLIAGVARGDRAMFAELYDRTSPKLYGLILRIQRDRALAEDVLQDVYLRVWRSAGAYAPEAGRPMPWLGAIARNRAIDSVREVGARRTVGDEGEDRVARLIDPHDAAAAFGDRDALAACLGRLDPAHSDCVVRAYCEGYSREELAQLHGRPVNTIKTWLHRALASLKACLGEAS